MLGIYLLLCVLALIIIGLLFLVAWDACEYDRRIIALETTVKDQATEIHGLNVWLNELETIKELP